MPRDYRLYLDDILEAVERIFIYVDRMDFEKFSADQKTLDAVARNLEIIGEAAKNLPDEMKRAMKEINWKKVIGFRNILIHEYFGMNKQMIWDIVQTKLLPLKISVTQYIKTICKDDFKDANY